MLGWWPKLSCEAVYNSRKLGRHRGAAAFSGIHTKRPPPLKSVISQHLIQFIIFFFHCIRYVEQRVATGASVYVKPVLVLLLTYL
jgi:hypothetical protein